MADEFQQVSIFETFILTNQFTKVDALNISLKEAILKREKCDPGIKRSNARLTWHSKYDMKDWIGDAYEDLMTMMMEQFTLMSEIHGAKRTSELRLRVTPWAMVQRDAGDYATPHTHPNSHWSCVYYVDPGMQPGKFKESGCIEFQDPRGAVGMNTVPGMNFNPRHIYAPKAGLMITFPAWLSHMVHPADGGADRIAISANCSIVKYKPPKKEASNA